MFPNSNSVAVSVLGLSKSRKEKYANLVYYKRRQSIHKCLLTLTAGRSGLFFSSGKGYECFSFNLWILASCLRGGFCTCYQGEWVTYRAEIKGRLSANCCRITDVNLCIIPVLSVQIIIIIIIIIIITVLYLWHYRFLEIIVYYFSDAVNGDWVKKACKLTGCDTNGEKVEYLQNVCRKSAVVETIW
jgi:hypothetical protein